MNISSVSLFRQVFPLLLQDSVKTEQDYKL